jgi:hypothetical protein
MIISNHCYTTRNSHDIRIYYKKRSKERLATLSLKTFHTQLVSHGAQMRLPSNEKLRTAHAVGLSKL